MAIKSFIPSNEIENIDVVGELLISGRYIYDIVRKLDNEIVNIDLIQNELKKFGDVYDEKNEYSFPNEDIIIKVFKPDSIFNIAPLLVIVGVLVLTLFIEPVLDGSSSTIV